VALHGDRSGCSESERAKRVRIPTLEDRTNQSFDIPNGQKFNIEGQETDACSATAVTETQETVVSQDVKRTGTAPPPKLDPPRHGSTLPILVVPAN
jgi:hypothetical protein